MTKTVIFHPKQGIRIPAKTLREAGFTPKKMFALEIKTPVIKITPQKQKNEEEEKDWLDELLEDPVAQKNFDRILKKAEEDYQAGRCKPTKELATE